MTGGGREHQAQQGSSGTADWGVCGWGGVLHPDRQGALGAACRRLISWASPLAGEACRGIAFPTHKVGFLAKIGSNQVIYFQKRSLSKHLEPVSVRPIPPPPIPLRVLGAASETPTLPATSPFTPPDEGMCLGVGARPTLKASEAGGPLRMTRRGHFTATVPLACRSLFL